MFIYNFSLQHYAIRFLKNFGQHFPQFSTIAFIKIQPQSSQQTQIFCSMLQQFQFTKSSKIQYLKATEKSTYYPNKFQHKQPNIQTIKIKKIIFIIAQNFRKETKPKFFYQKPEKFAALFSLEIEPFFSKISPI